MMSDIHVIDSADSDEIRLVFHYPVPDENNAVGVNFRTAIVNSGVGQSENPDGTPGRRTIMRSGTGPGQITIAEETQLDAGELFEFVTSERVGLDFSLAQMQAKAQAKYATDNVEVQRKIAARLKYFGATTSAT